MIMIVIMIVIVVLVLKLILIVIAVVVPEGQKRTAEQSQKSAPQNRPVLSLPLRS